MDVVQPFLRGTLLVHGHGVEFQVYRQKQWAKKDCNRRVDRVASASAVPDGHHLSLIKTVDHGTKRPQQVGHKLMMHAKE
jgi:hypothetical protein